MALAWLALAGFRSYQELQWAPSPGVNLVIGGNGVGKTNLLEAVGMLFTGASFRGAPDRALVASGRDMAAVRGATDQAAPHTIEMVVHRTERRRLLLNGSRPGRLSDLAEAGRVLVFIPEHLELVKGGPGRRRDWLDETAGLLWPLSRADQAEYQKTLRHRNAFLKTGDRDDRVTLEVWDHRLALSGARVMAARARAFHEVANAVAGAVSAIAGMGERISIDYRSDWGGALDTTVPPAEWERCMQKALEACRNRDFLVGSTTVGLHRDEPILTLNQHDARLYASQGEQRTLALAFRLGVFGAVEDVAGSRPILVLDDVFSELDRDRAEALVEWLPATQTFISAVEEEKTPISGDVWRVTPGCVR
ncbi:MAG: DNA replication and repair protein RecF [Acidimicrobiia bacterium]|nr:DNA replication and repair protein RecF [Acidimicrobiia bacterium]